MTREHFCDAWVCTDCYFAHHYGAHQHEEDIVLYDEDGNLVDETVPLWYVGEDDEPVGGWHEIRVNHTLDHNREPLGLIGDAVEVFDHTCSDHYYGQSCETNDDGENVEPCEQCGSSDDENGIQEFSWSRCEGCGSPLGGSRYRLSLWMTKSSRPTGSGCPRSPRASRCPSPGLPTSSTARSASRGAPQARLICRVRVPGAPPDHPAWPSHDD